MSGGSFNQLSTNHIDSVLIPLLLVHLSNALVSITWIVTLYLFCHCHVLRQKIACLTCIMTYISSVTDVFITHGL